MTNTEIPVDHIARVEGHGQRTWSSRTGEVKTFEMAVVEPAACLRPWVRGRPSRRSPTSPRALVAFTVEPRG